MNCNSNSSNSVLGTSTVSTTPSVHNSIGSSISMTSSSNKRKLLLDGNESDNNSDEILELYDNTELQSLHDDDGDTNNNYQSD